MLNLTHRLNKEFNAKGTTDNSPALQLEGGNDTIKLKCQRQETQ